MKRFFALAIFAIAFTAVSSLAALALCEEYNFGPSHINALLKSGNLIYMGTDNGLMVQDTSDNSMQHYHMGNSPLKAFQVICLARKSNGSIWIGTDNGLFRMTNGVISRYMASALGGSIITLHVDENDYIWLGRAGESLYKINQSETLVEYFVDAPRTICSGSGGSLWLGFNDELRQWHPTSGTLNTYNSSNSALPSNTILCVKNDSQGNVWVLSDLGLTKITPDGGMLTYGGDYAHPLAGCLSISVDAQNRVWIVKSTMLLRWDGMDLLTYSAAELGVQGYSLKSVLLADTLYYGARGFLGKAVNDDYVVHAIFNTELLNYYISSVHRDVASRFWITYEHEYLGGYPDCYSCVDGGQVTHCMIPGGEDYSFRLVITNSDYHYAILYNSIYKVTGTQWTNLGYHNWMYQYFFSNGKAYFNPENEGIYVLEGENGWNIDIDFPGSLYNYAGMLTADYEGKLWFVNNGNLVSYADSVFTLHPNVTSTHLINCMNRGRDGYMYMGCRDGEVWRYDGNNYQQFLTIPGDDVVQQIVFGDSGEIWFRTEKSVLVWHELTGFQSLNYTSSSSLLNSIVKMPGDKLLISTKTGYFIYKFYLPTSVEDEYVVQVPPAANLYAYPNPSSGEVVIEATSGKDISQVQVYNMRGQLVRRCVMPAKERILWDGKDGSGVNVASGVYLISARVDGKLVSRKILIRK